MNEELRTFLAGQRIGHGVGDKEVACSISAINIWMTGKVTDKRPDCMCSVLHRAVIGWNDAMPEDRLNSARWRELLVRLPGTKANDEVERKRALMILDHMWTVVLPQLLPVAEKHGFATEWQEMLTKRTEAAARAAAEAAAARARSWAAAKSAAWAAWAVRATKAAKDAKAAQAAAWAAAKEAKAAASDDFWNAVNIENLLDKLISVEGA